jgi:hypothetical protein
MRLTIVPEDKLISIDNHSLLGMKENLSWIPSNIHAVQWYETWGEVEYNDGSPNEKIEELGIYQQAVIDHQNEIQRIEDEKIAAEIVAENARDYWKELRVIRNFNLQECDWTQIPDAPLSDTQKTEWQNYRQLLRNLPENIQDPKPLVLDSSHSDWPTKPQE